ncbi:hypothetical protein KY331_05665 [Candidatus Woesearchaeota archaeon]|nr:hypothetical protein [Candidatus Woesearchaeota archaeon]
MVDYKKREKKAALIIFITALLIGMLSILGIDKNSLTSMVMVKLVQYSGNPVFMIVVAIGLIFTIALLYSYIFMRSW